MIYFKILLPAEEATRLVFLSALSVLLNCKYKLVKKCSTINLYFLLTLKCLDSSRPWLCYWILHSLELLDQPITKETAKQYVCEHSLIDLLQTNTCYQANSDPYELFKPGLTLDLFLLPTRYDAIMKVPI